MERAKHVAKLILLVCFFCAALCIGALVSIYTQTQGLVYEQGGPLPAASVAIVLGASIRSNGDLSPVLAERADAAYLLYSQKKVTKILVTGDNATLQYNEVYPVGKYLLAKGVPKDDIFLDYAGFDTYSSMYRAGRVFGVSSAVVVSQRFHLFRALYIARSRGISAVGFDAGKPGDHYILNSLREIPASLKAVFDVFSGRVPKYLGPTISMVGSGTKTWVEPPQDPGYFKKTLPL